MNGRGTGRLQSVERATRVLDHLAAAPGPVPAKAVAKALGLTLPTTYHPLTTLVTGGYLVHLADEHAYALGHRVDDLARGLHRQIAVPRSPRARSPGATGSIAGSARSARSAWPSRPTSSSPS